MTDFPEKSIEKYPASPQENPRYQYYFGPQMAPSPKREKSNFLHIFLFVLTVFTTLAAGTALEGSDPFSDWRLLAKGIPFSFTLLAILGFHEFGHYFMSKKHGVKATLPYFIPGPTIIGTFGAFIKIKSPMYNRKVLFDIGAAGPIAGFIVALPILIYGIYTSQILELTPGSGITLGDSLLMTGLVRFITGEIPPGFDLNLNSVAFAGWIGMLVTAFNLIPVGQLDGGHISYAVFGKSHSTISKTFFVLLLPMGFFWYGWIFWAVLLLILRLKHPAPIDAQTQLDTKRKLLSLLCLVIFILCFIPVPFKF